MWARLIRAPGWPQPWPTILTVLLAGAAVGMLVVQIARRRFGLEVDAITWPVLIWAGLALFLILTLFGIDLVRWAQAAATTIAGADPGLRDPERRVFLSRLAVGGALVASLGLLGAGLRSVLGGPYLTRVRIVLERLPAALSGLSIVQITDVHVGHVIRRDYVAEVVRRVNALAPDVVVITGDLVDGPVARLGAAVEPLGELRATHGVFFVSGNHDYYAGIEPWVLFLERLGVRVLRNERVSIGEGADSFDLAGIEDPVGRRTGHGPDLPAALAGRDPSRELVLLAHRPSAVGEAAEHGVGLQLSGHTHGGQIWPFTWLAHLVFPVVAGLARVGATQLYVNRGTGYIAIPVRLGSPSEITRVELVAAVGGESGGGSGAS